ncbi:MAG: SdrD B-like domain-containing protein [Acidimicrobiales bacterium]
MHAQRATTIATARAHARARRQRLFASSLALAALSSALVVGAAPVSLPAVAAGSPNIVVTKTADARTLIGGTTTVTLRACNPTGQPNGYNLSFRDVVPSGLAATGATPAPTRTVADQPTVGQTTLIWENVSDLLTGTCTSITYGIDTNPDGNLATNQVGTSFGTTGGAYVSANAFAMPDFDGSGQPTTDIDGSDTDGPTATVISAFLAEKDAGDHGEQELLRGVHGSEPVVYTLRVRNNPDAPSNGMTVVDDLPANLEFLGCSSYGAAGYVGADHTTDAPTNHLSGAQTEEYPGSGALAAGPSTGTCIQPSSVATLANGTTRVTWSSGALGAAASLAPGGVLTLTYLAGVPLRANTDVWPNGKPTDTGLGQGRNLDNNSGAPTSETGSEPSVTNSLSATGTYVGPSLFGSNPTLTDTDTDTVTAEDLVIRKSMTGQVVQGTVVTTTLSIETGEYRDTTALVVTDTLPDGLCPIAASALSPDSDCGTGADPTIDAGSGAVTAPLTSAVENNDGTWTLTWDQSTVAELAALGHSSELTLVFQARVRTHYQENLAPEASRPVLNFDSLTNQVALQGLDWKRPEIDAVTGDPETDGLLDFDTSSSSIDGIGPSIDKRVSQRTGALATGSGLTDGTVGDICRDGVGITWADGDPTAVTGYGPGDYVCFDLRATFPADVDADGVQIQDLLPPEFSYVANSARRVTSGGSPDSLPNTSVNANTAGDDVITFSVENSGQVPSGPSGQQFHWTIAARILDPSLGAAYDINANLMKMTTRNTAGQVFQYRDQSTAVWTEPQVSLDKTNDASGPRTGGDTVTYTIKLWNTGNVDAANAVVWDRLPAGISCADVTGSTPTATCSSGVLVWDAADIPTVTQGTTLGTAPVSLVYTVDLPDTVDPARTYTNTAGVREYTAPSNAADTPFVYYPANNIDPAVTPNTTAASDTSAVTIRSASHTKVQQSSVNDANGNSGNASPATTAERATPGELLTYTMTATVPEGTSVVDVQFTDVLDTDLVLAATPTWTFAGVAGDPAWTLTAPAIGSGGTIRLDRAGTHTNAAGSGDDQLVVTVVARVSNAGGTVAGSAISNNATFSWLPAPAIGTSRVTLTSNSVSGTVVEPSITLTKNENDADDIVAPNDTLTYTLTVAAGTGTNRSSAYDVVVVDTLPAGVTVVNSGVPVADGGTVGPENGIWSAAGRTITWNVTTTPAQLGAIAPGASATLHYDVVVDDPTVSGAVFTNNATSTATSMSGTVTGERTTYTSSTSHTVSAPLASIAKSVSPNQATIGDTVTYTVDATVPAGITAYDLTVLDVLPDGVDFLSFGTIAYTGVSTNCPSLAGAQAIPGQTANANGSTTLGWFVDDLAAPSSNPCTVRFTYTARVDSTYEPEGTAVAAGNALVNAATVYWNQLNSVSSLPATPPAPAGYTRSVGPVTATLTVREPVIRIDKDVSQSPCDATPGNIGDNDTCQTDVGSTTYTYTLRITNSSNWPAYDISVVDSPDSDLVNVTVPPSSGVVTVVDGTVPALQWDISTIAANSSVTITYTAQLAGSASLHDGEPIVNTADVSAYYAEPLATRQGDPAAEWRTYAQGGPGGDVTPDTVTMTVGFPEVTIVKTAVSDATDARAGTPFTWQLVATNNATEPTAAAFGVDLADVLPADWVYQAGSTSITTPYGSATTEPTCVPDCATAGATLYWTNVVNGAGQPLTPGATVTIRFDAVPQAVLLAVGTTGAYDHVNTGKVVGAEDANGASANATGDYTGPDATANARIRRTDLSVTKTPSAGPYTFGGDVNWTITVTNGGPDTATGVTLLDALPVGLVYVNTVSATQGSYSGVSGIWTVGSLANGATATLVIRTRLNQIGAITNRAEVRTSNQWDLDSTPQAVADVADEDDDATSTINAVSTSLGDFVWYDVDGDGTADVGEPGIPGVTAQLESAGLDDVFGTSDDFFGPDGVSGGGDDITVTSAVTNGTGFYGFSNLPTGRYRVRIDSTSLPAGMTPTHNDDGVLDHLSSTVTLNSSTGYLLADFGYTGTGSLGDTVWLDQDASGGATQQVGEPGLGGIDVTLVWGGFDGDLSTTTDNVTYPIDTTDGSGHYGFSLLPAGPYRVTIDHTDLPTGTTPTYDLDGIGSADNVTTSLTAAQHRTDVDLSYAGTGSIGDRVWYDRDGDGVSDSGETGFGGIDVTVTWRGPDGLPGGGDDVVFTTTTDSTGTYLVDHLPAGTYTVTVDSADLPAGAVPTFDLDGTGTAHTSDLVLGDAQDRVDADFGYRGVASVGDHVWFDVDGDGTGTPEPGEPGLAGVPVTVTWAGPDASFGTGDDVVITTTTDADGDYLVTDLPFGAIRVQVDTSALPGFAPTFDGDGIGTANQVTLLLTVDDVLTAGVDEANPRSADFAYTGTGSLGDFVWQDLDADGITDVGEPGIDAIDVTVTWAGLDGIAGTADDVVWTTTTVAGTYLVDRLPAGSFTVVVDTADLPTGLVQVSDPDATLDARTSTTLAPAEDRTDADFGYQLQADLSLDKSHTGRFEVGRTGVYSMVVQNAGPASAVTPRLTDTLPAGLTYMSATGTGVTCAANAQLVTCDLPTMAVGANVTITLTVDVGRAAAPSVTNTAQVLSITTDPDLTDNSDRDPTDVPLADLQVAKRLDGTLVRNSTSTYVLDVTNLGPSPSGGPVVVTDELPAGLEFVDAVSTDASCTAAGALVTCRSNGAMAVSQSLSISLHVRVTAASGTAIVNTASVVADPSLGSSAPADPVATNNSSATAAATVSNGLPSTGWARLADFLRSASWVMGLGALAVIVARRRRPTPMI